MRNERRVDARLWDVPDRRTGSSSLHEQRRFELLPGSVTWSGRSGDLTTRKLMLRRRCDNRCAGSPPVACVHHRSSKIFYLSLGNP